MIRRRLSTTICALVLGVVVLSLFAASVACAEGTEPVAQTEGKTPSEPLMKAIGDAIQRVKPSLVRIFVVAANYANGREVKYETVGSGVIITKDGHIITNHHVAGHAKQIICTLSDKEEIAADLVGTDPLADIAVIKLRGDGKREFPAVVFGDSSGLRVGDRVLAMGSPLALSQSVTMGIVSNTEIVMPKFLPASSRFMLEGEDVGSIVRWIGHDAQIFGGNSGGPLVNLSGEIVGINEINIGLSGAIPGNQAKEVAENILRAGKVRRSWLGLDIQPLLGHETKRKGALVGGVMDGSPAEKAGFLPGDILLAIAGKEVNVRFPEEVPILNQAIMDIQVGGTVEAKVLRDGKELSLHVTSQEKECAVPGDVELPQWGMTARNLSLIDSKEMKRKSRDGVVVTSVRPGGPCWGAEPKLTYGDVIVKVGNTEVRNVEGLLKLTAELTKGKTGLVPVLVAFDKAEGHYITVAKLCKKDSENQGMDVRKAWLPVATQVITKDIAAGLGDPTMRGMRITQVYKDGGAEKAGLLVGDVITAFNGETITPSSPEEGDLLDEIVRQYSVGTKAGLDVLRDAKNIKVEVVLEQSPKSQKDMKKYTDDNFEFTVRDVCFMDDARGSCAKDGSGIIVESISEGGWASLARLSIGDLILAVDGRPVTDISIFEKEMKRAAAEKPKSVVFKVRRSIHTMFVQLEPAWPRAE